MRVTIETCSLLATQAADAQMQLPSTSTKTDTDDIERKPTSIPCYEERGVARPLGFHSVTS